MFLGFGNGAFYPINEKRIDRFSQKQTDIFKAKGKANAIELHCNNKYTLGFLLEKVPAERFADFEYISLHAPVLAYQKSKKSREVLDLIRKISEKLPLKNIVLHPDTVKNWNVFLEYQDLPLSIENMDNNKEFGKTVEDLVSIFEKFPFLKFTMDLQHCYVCDSSLKIVNEFYQAFKDRLVEYHLSAYSEPILHDAFYKNPEQLAIIKSVPDKNIPIILESSFWAFDEAAKEFNYVYNNLQ